MLLNLHLTRWPDEIVVIDINLRCEIPHTMVDYKTIEIDDAFAETASVLFLDYPLSLTQEERAAHKSRCISGNEN